MTTTKSSAKRGRLSSKNLKRRSRKTRNSPSARDCCGSLKTGSNSSFEGGLLLSRALPDCTPEFAAALAELVKAGDDTEADFSLAVLQNYPGKTSTYVVLKEIVSRFPHDDRKMSGVRISIDSTGVVFGEFGLADAWRVKKESLTHWLTDERQAVKAFAEKHIAELDRMIAAERRRVEAERERRNRSNDQTEPGGYRAKPF